MDDKNLKKIIDLRHELHANPEPSNYEINTKSIIMNFIKENTNLEVVDRGKWFYAIYHSPIGKKNIAFRADFDAILMDEGIELPYGSINKGVAHKCGHDGHSAALAGFALEIDQNGSDNNIFFLFQHAEESGDGAFEAKVFIKECNIEEIFAYHNMSGFERHSISIIDGTSHFASKGMTIHMIGKPTHASQPEYGINPAYAIAKIIDALPHFTNSSNNKGIVLCTVIQVDVGERAFGIAASKGDLLMTIRAEYEEELVKLEKSLEKLSNELGKEYGLKVGIEYNDVFPVTSNHKESSDKVRKAATSKGFKLNEMDKGFRGSEDYGHYLKETKGAIFYVGNGVNYPQLHTYEYDFPDEILETAVEMFKELSSY